MSETADHHPEHQRHRFSVGLTGGIGSGKSTVATLFAAHGAAIIDTDLIAHQLTAPGGAAITALTRAFGDTYITDLGALDRDRMRALVFSDHAARQQLEAITHPLIRQETMRAAKLANGPYVMFVVPLLVESGDWQQRYTRILVIDCEEQVQIARVMQRNQLSMAQVEAIMAAQASRAARLQAADDVIDNNGDSAALMPHIERLHRYYSALAASPIKCK